MTYVEEAVSFVCEGDTLWGILACPETPAETAIVVIVGGPQYRVGSHRQFVLLSRELASAGYAVLRFDYRGMGDSEGAQRTFDNVGSDIGAAIGILQQRVPSVKHVALWGLCDGASAALLYFHETHDPRVNGLCLLNPWIRSEASLAKTQVKHYYGRRLMQKEFWYKLASGKVTLRAVVGFVQKTRLAAARSNQESPQRQPFQKRMATAWRLFPNHILLLLSGEDYTAKEFLEVASTDESWKGALTHPNLVRHDLQSADHTFSNEASRAIVVILTLEWLRCSPTEHDA